MEKVCDCLGETSLATARFSKDVDQSELTFGAHDFALNFVKLFVHACVSVRIFLDGHVGVSSLHRGVYEQIFTVLWPLVNSGVIWVEDFLIVFLITGQKQGLHMVVPLDDVEEVLEAFVIDYFGGRKVLADLFEGFPHRHLLHYVEVEILAEHVHEVIP